MICPASWFFISQTATSGCQCFLPSEIEEVVLSEVDQTLKNASVFKGKNMVGEL